MINLVAFINKKEGWKTVASCCGHQTYPPTLLVRHKSYSEGYALEVFSDKIIWRKSKFYRKDQQGRYYIPETIGEK